MGGDNGFLWGWCQFRKCHQTPLESPTMPLNWRAGREGTISNKNGGKSPLDKQYPYEL